LDLEAIQAIEGLPCDGGYYLRTTKPLPPMLPFGNTRFYTASNYYTGDISFVSKDRFKYVGHNKWLQNTIYACLDPNGRIYLNSTNPQFLYLKEAKMTAIFENAEEASDLECNNQEESKCDILERDFPIEDALVAPLVELIVKELAPSVAVQEDNLNNAADDRSTQSNG
jgi:hypothetical protein